MAVPQRVLKVLRTRPWHPLLRQSLLVVGVMSLLLLSSGPAIAQSSGATEYQIKAAFLYNFTRFVEWPADVFNSPDTAMQICILGENPFGEDLDTLVHNKMVAGHALRVVQLRKAPQIKDCQILFIAAPAGSQTREALQRAQGLSVLTVGEVPGFASQGGIINFVLENERVRFEINDKAATEARLKISSKLLSLARSVTE